MSSSAPEVYCRQKAAPAGSSFYYSTLYYPAAVKRDLYALHALHNEIEQIIEECSDPGVAHMKLAWWSEEIQRLFTGTPRHPVSQELGSIISRHVITAADLSGLIRHYEQRINPVWSTAYQDFLDHQLDGPGTVWKFTARICGASNRQTIEIVSRLGCLFGMFYLLQNYRAMQPLQQEQQLAFIQHLIIDMEDCRRRLPETDRMAQTGALIMANIILRTCEEIQRGDHNLDRDRISLTPFRKLWIAWRTHKNVMRKQ